MTPSCLPTTGPADPRRVTRMPDVEALFTTLLVIVAIAIVWFAVYVIYRLYADSH